MAIVNSASALQALFVAFDLKYQSVFQATPRYADKLAMTIPVGTETLRLPWIGKLPVMREWVGDRVINNAFSKYYDIVPRLFELTEGLDKSKIDDDTWGLFASQVIPQMAEQVAKWPDYRLADVIQANGLWSDNLPFFNSAHPVNVDDGSKGTYANDWTGRPLTHENYRYVRQQMMAQVGEDGKNLGIRPNLLIHPSNLEADAAVILKAENIAPGAFGLQTTQVGAITNTLRGTAEMLWIPEFDTNPNTWYLADTTRPIKPFVWAIREAPSFAMRTDPRDPVVFDRNQYLFGARARGEAGFGFPFLVHRATA
jgi:phage major head subunit gpT-like protein